MTWQWMMVSISFLGAVVVIVCTKMDSMNVRAIRALEADKNRLMKVNSDLSNENYDLKRDIRKLRAE